MNTKKKFGTFEGVFIPSIEAILGTVLFLLLPGQTASAGLINMIVIIILAHTVTVSTAFSLADCATNLNTIGAGGMYALVRKSLGIALGGSIGIQLYLAQAASIAFYSVGFAEPLQPILVNIEFFSFLKNFTPEEQQNIIAASIYLVFFLTVFTGADFTIKLQKIILVVLIAAIGAILLSPAVNKTTILNGEEIPLFTGKINLFGTGKVSGAGLILVFTAFFPAVTGIGAGVGMSGDLKTPQRSIVKGTFAAIAAGFLVYIFAALIFSLMDAETLQAYPLTEVLGIRNLSVVALAVFTGILVATSSSGLSYFMTGPRTLFALIHDGVLPNKWSFLKNDIFKGGTEPRIAIILTGLLGGGIIFAPGGLDTIAAIVGIAFLAVYGWINLSAFLERISRNPSFRPSSKGHWLISLYGFIFCSVVIIMFDPPVSLFIGLGIGAFQIIIFLLILNFKSKNQLEGVWWGVVFSLAGFLLKKLRVIVQGNKNWRPVVKVFVFSKNDGYNNAAIRIGEMITQYQGLVSASLITIKEETNEHGILKPVIPLNKVIVKNRAELTSSVTNIIQAGDHTHIQSNTVLLEFDSRLNWEQIIDTAVYDSSLNLLVYKDNPFFSWKSIKSRHHEYIIDVWWRGTDNGNLSALISYIILQSNRISKIKTRVRIIRKIYGEEEKTQAEAELNALISRARLQGSPLILPHDNEPIIDTIREVSRNSNLIMIGLPDSKKEKKETRTLFENIQYSFHREVEKFENLPPVLFVKASQRVNLIEE